MKILYWIVIFISLIVFCTSEQEYSMKVHFIDVGHGDCIFIETPDDNIKNNGKYEGHRILIDAGKRNRGCRYVIPYLKTKGMKAGDTIDYVIVTHVHEDHIGGLPSVYDTFQVNNTLDPGCDYTSATYAHYHDKASHEPNSNFYFNLLESGLITGYGDYLDLGDELKVRILHTDPSISSGINNTSIVLRIEYKDISFLLTGDAEGKERNEPSSEIDYVEEFLVNTYGTELRSTVLKVGHHGSETASTDAFIQAVQPEYAVICAGCGVFSGTPLPDQSVIGRYTSAGAVVLRTDEDDEGKSESEAGGDDNIVMTTNGKTMEVIR